MLKSIQPHGCKRSWILQGIVMLTLIGNMKMPTNPTPVESKVETPLKLYQEDAILEPISPLIYNQLPH